MHDKRLRDILPQPVPPLPPAGLDADLSIPVGPVIGTPLPEPCIDNITTEPPNGVPSRIFGPLRRVLDTTRNSFGLFRRYVAQKFPSHDPDGEVNSTDLSDIVDVNSGKTDSVTSHSYGPFPNRSSFLLGDWYWNRGAQKSQQDFKALLDIVGTDDFRPHDVQGTNWDKVNTELVSDEPEAEEWMDEVAGWKETPVTISVPFHRQTDTPGVQDYSVANLHHRSLVSVIREKIRDPSSHAHFHFEPYELHWQPNDRHESIRIHGELYTSQAFTDAHNALQESPREPKCDLDRVVVALMFWSDATQLTNFGNAKLWPLYMFFGNESKYRRGKPSSNCCEHVAYFESVRHRFSINDQGLTCPP